MPRTSRSLAAVVGVVPVLALLTACPQKRAAPPPPPPASSATGCPSASGVYVASFVQPVEGEQGYTGWVLPLHDVKVATVDGMPGYASVDAATATAAGVPPPPRELWLLPPNAAMCKVTVGGYYAAAVDVPGAANLAYGVELTGCPAPSDPSDAVGIVLVSADPPANCRVALPKPIGARLGAFDDRGQWTAPTTETPIPAGFVPLIPTKPCTAPACEQLWSFAQADVDGAPIAWAGAVNWLTRETGGACTWKTGETWSGLFVAGPGGEAVQVTEALDHPLALTAVLSDKAGHRVVLARGPGEYATYDVFAGNARLGRHLVWLVDAPEAYELLDHLGPDCPAADPSAPAAPAP